MPPTRTFGADTGSSREYTLQALVGGKLREVHGYACRQADGSWRNVD
ncbi:MAG: hypothetical protein P8008_07935 [Gammaproteobacteria bacterium]